MSRAINIQQAADMVRAACDKHSFRISSLEPLDSGGVRIVLLDPRDADALRVLMKGKLIDGVVTRSSSHVGRQWVAKRQRPQ